MKASKKQLIGLLIGLVVLVLGLTVVACSSAPAKKKPTPDVTNPVEAGVYYYDYNGSEYLLSLTDSYTVTFVAGNVILTGTYSRSGNNITLKFTQSGASDMTAQIDSTNSVISLTYSGVSMSFLRRVLYGVSFNTDGGSSIDTVQVLNGKSISKPADPTRAGYTFLGWYKDKEYKTPFIFDSDIITGDTVLYAQWAPSVLGENVYTISFDVGDYEGATAVPSKETVGGKLYNLATPSARSGYTFAGWWYSVTGKADELTYRVDANTVFTESTTLYAVWQETTTGSKLASPLVSVIGKQASWDQIAGAQYRVQVVGTPQDPSQSIPAVDRIVTEPSTEVPYTTAGTYTVTVTALSGTGASNNSEPTVRTYKFNPLSRVSLFEVVSDTLLWNAVDHAEKYVLKIDCGNESHNHDALDNGQSTYFNFANCEMQPGGIKFTVTAQAAGYTSSVSAEYVVCRDLAAISAIRYDEATQIVSWQAVPNATNYEITVQCGTAGHAHTQLDLGNATSYDLKECTVPTGGLKVSVTPRSKGYNSPAATELTITAAQKSMPATPTNLRIVGTVLSWNAVADADKYTVRIGDKEVEAKTNSLDLAAQSVNWIKDTDYNISVRAHKGDKMSAWSDMVDARYYAMYSTMSYNRNTVTWRLVIGATGYDVRVNEGAVIKVTNGSNFARVKLTAATNKIEVRFYNDDETSEWAPLTVNAYTLTYDTRGGVAAAGVSLTQYYALGDELTLLSGDDMTKEGYTLGDFYTTPGGAEGNGLRFAETTYTTPGDMTLYASWVPKSYKITLNYTDGGTGPAEATVIFGQPYTLPVPETITDGTTVFGGWCANMAGTAAMYTDENGVSLGNWSIAADTEVYARWLPLFSYEKQAGGSAGYYYMLQAGSISRKISSITVPDKYQGPDDDVAYPVVQIGDRAFNSCDGIEVINLPNTIEIIQPQAFESYTTLREVNVYQVEGGTNVYFSQNGVLYFNNATASEISLWAMPRAKTGVVTLDNRVTTIPTRAFYHSTVTELNIPASVTYVADNAFYYSEIPTVNFLSPEQGETSLTLRLEINAFYYANRMVEITLPARDFVIWDSTENAAVTDPDFNTQVFASCSVLSVIDVDPRNTFYQSIDGLLCTTGTNATVIYCPKNRSGKLTIPNSIVAIGSRAFSGCTAITEVEIPNWVRTIEDYAFSGYTTRLPGASYDTTVYGCTGLLKVTFAGGGGVAPALAIGNNAFGTNLTTTNTYCNKLATVEFKDGSRVVSIGEYAFARCPIVTMTLPSSLAELKTAAFANCTALESITYSESEQEVVVGDRVFENCTSFTTVKLPANIKEFKDGVFAGCTSLANIEVDPANPVLSSVDGVLFNKAQTEILFYPVGKSGNYTIPSTVVRIGGGAFSGKSNITDITIGKNVTYIGDGAFRNCENLETVTFEDGGEQELVIGTSAFNYCRKLTTFKLPDRVKHIPARMLFFDNLLTEIYIPDGVESIGEFAFGNVASSGTMTNGAAVVIEKLTIPASVKSIGVGAFYLVNVGEVEFLSANPLTKLTFETAEERHTAGSLSNQYLDTYYPFEIEVGESKAFYYAQKLAKVTLREGVEELPSTMFYMCSALKEINIPGTVQTMGTRLFYGCSALTQITFDERAIDPETGKNVPLELMDGSNSSTTGGSSGTSTTYYGVFSGCSALEYIALPEGTTRISDNAFGGCTKLKEIVIPSTVQNGPYVPGDNQITAIGTRSFENCTSLETVTFTPGGTGDFSLGNASFYNCTALKTITLPNRLSDSHINNASGSWTVSGVRTGYYSGLGTQSGVADTYNKYVTTNTNRSFYGCSALTEVKVEQGGVNYTADDGILYTADMKELVFVPYARTKDVTVPYTVELVRSYAFLSATSEGNKVQKVTFLDEPENDADDPEAAAEDAEERTLVIGEAVFPALASNSAKQSMGPFSGATNLKEVYFPKRLAHISDYAFYGCSSLEKVVFAEETQIEKIGYYTFGNCSKLTSFEVPDSVTEIDAGAFYNDAALATITINQTSKINKVGDNAFSRTAIKYIYLPPAKVMDLGVGVFSDCTQLVEVHIPSTITRFEGLLSGSNNVTILDIYTVYDENDQPVQGSGSVMVEDGVVVEKTEKGMELSYYPTTKKDEVYEVPVGVTVIKANAFQGNGYIKKIIIPNTVELVDDKAFYTTSALKEVVFEADDVKHYVLLTDEEKETYNDFRYKKVSEDLYEQDDNGDYKLLAPAKALVIGSTNSTSVSNSGSVFAHSIGLEKVYFPSRLESIASFSFHYCKNLTTVTFDANCKLGTIPRALFNFTALKYGGTRQDIADNPTHPFEIPDLVSEIGTGSSSETVFGEVEQLTVPANLKTIGNYAFNGLTKLKSVVFESDDDLNSVGTYMFQNCSELESVQLPSRLTTISNYMFNGCAKLKKINIPSAVTSIGSNAFSGCALLGTDTAMNGRIELPNVTIINSSAFSGCEGLETVILGTKLTQIAGSAFLNCVNLSKITYDESNTEYDLYLPNSLTTMGTGGQFANTAITSAYIPGSVTSITTIFGLNQTNTSTPTTAVVAENLKKVVFGTDTANNSYPTSLPAMFIRLTALEEVVLSTNSRMTSITAGAFSYSGLKKITIPANIATINRGAFSNCPRLESVTFDEGNGSLTLTAGSQFSNGGTGEFNSNYQYYGVFAFSGTEAEKLTVDMSKRNISTISQWTFMGTGDLDVKFSSNTATIDLGAFQQSGITSITIPTTVKTVNRAAFADSGLTKVVFEDESDNKDDNELTISAGTSNSMGTTTTTMVTVGAFAFCADLIEVDMSARKITEVSNYTFYNCTNLATVKLSVNEEATEDAPATTYTTRIGQYAFQYAGVENIEFLRGLETIDSWAFWSANMETVTLPNTLKTLGYGAFYGIEPLTSVVFEEGSIITEFVVRDGNAFTFAFNPNLTSVVLPQSLEIIGSYAFSTTGLASVSIPKTVKSIGNYAFVNNYDLATLTFEKDGDGTCALTTIDAGAFVSTALTTVVIPKSVTSLGTNPFRSCDLLTSLTVETGNTTYVAEDNVVYNIDKTILYIYAGGSEFTLPDTVTTIASYAFAYSKFAGTLNVTKENFKIGDSAFEGSGVTSVTLGNGAELGTYAFSECEDLVSVTLGEAVIVGSMAFENTTSLTSFTVSKGVTIELDAFTGSGLTLTEEMLEDDTKIKYNDFDAELPGTLIFADNANHTVPANAFQNNTDKNITSIVIAEGITTIGNYAFDGCTNLESVVLPSTLTTIGTYAFRNTGIKEIFIPKSVKVIMYYAFRSNSELTKVEFEEGSELTQFNGSSATALAGTTAVYTFADCPKLETVILPEGLEKLPGYIFQNDTSLSEITIPYGVTEIYNYAFDGCTNLTSVTFEAEKIDVTPEPEPTEPDPEEEGEEEEEGETAAAEDEEGERVYEYVYHLTTLGTYVFRNTGLVSIDLPDTLTSIGTYAFAGTKLTGVTIPVSVTTIGVSAFSIETLTSVTFEKDEDGNVGFTSLTGFNASGLTSVSIPKNVVTIAASAFQNCESLTSVTFEKDDDGNCAFAAVGNSAFSNTGLTSISLPASFTGCTTATGTTAATNVFENCAALTTVTFEKDDDGNCAAIRFGNYMFRYSGLTSISIPATVTTTGTYTFQGCENLTTVTFEKDSEGKRALTTIGAYAFEASGLTAIEIPCTLTSTGVGNYSLANCPNLTSVTWEKNEDGRAATVTIQNNAFNGSTNLKHMILPSTITLYTNALAGFGEDCYIYFDGLLAPSTAWQVQSWLEGCSAKLIWGWSEDKGFIGADGNFADGTSPN